MVTAVLQAIPLIDSYAGLDGNGEPLTVSLQGEPELITPTKAESILTGDPHALNQRVTINGHRVYVHDGEYEANGEFAPSVAELLAKFQ
jgi:hypothetical protein